MLLTSLEPFGGQMFQNKDWSVQVFFCSVKKPLSLHVPEVSNLVT